MANLIQVKRSSTTAVPSTLTAGEFAYTGNGEILYIGSVNGAANTANVVAIGGARYPGVLTANQSLVANSSSWMDVLQTAKLIVGNVGETINVTSISVSANTTQLGGSSTGSNTELASTYAIKTYVDGRVASIGLAVPNTQVTYSNSGVLAGSAGFTFDKNTTILTIGNTVSVGTGATNATVNTSLIQIASAGSSANLTPTALTIGSSVVNTSTVAVGSNVAVNATTVFLGNTTSNVNITSTVISAAASGASANLLSTGLVVGISTVNATAVAVGANVITNATAIFVGNSSVNSVLTSSELTLSGNATISSSANVGGMFNVVGAATFANNLTVTGATTNVQNMNVQGNLTVTGTLTTINANNLTITDSMIQLASNNTIGDVIDIGFFATYEAGDAGANENTGLFRDASDGGVYKLFNNLETAPGLTVDTSDPTFAYATLQSFIKTGGSTLTGLIANASHIAITANSTLNVAIVANTLTLSSALAVGSGGTGATTFTTKGVLYGNGSSALQVTSAGTYGQVLQADATGVPIFATLDGGTF
jgi:hypothetical protein